MAPGRHGSFDSLSSNASRASIKRALRQSSWRTTHSDCPMDSGKISRREVARLRYLEYFTIGGNEFPNQGLRCPFPPCELLFSSLSEITSHMQMCPTFRGQFRCPTCSRLHDLHMPEKSEPRKRRASIIQDGKRILQKMKRGTKGKKDFDFTEKNSVVAMEASPSEYTLGSLHDYRRCYPPPLARHAGHRAGSTDSDTTFRKDVDVAHVASPRQAPASAEELLYPADLSCFQGEKIRAEDADIPPSLSLEGTLGSHAEGIQFPPCNDDGFFRPARSQLHHMPDYTKSASQTFGLPPSLYDEQSHGPSETLQIPEPGGWGLKQMGADDLVTSTTIFAPTSSTLHTESNPFEAEMRGLLEKQSGAYLDAADSIPNPPQTPGYCLPPPSATTPDFAPDIGSQFQPDSFAPLPNCSPTNLLLPNLQTRPANPRQVSSESCKTLVDPEQQPAALPGPDENNHISHIPDPLLDGEGHCACPIEDCKYSSRTKGTREEHRLSKYRRHWRSQHGKKPPVFCPGCGRRFSRRDNMRKHSKSQSCDAAAAEGLDGSGGVGKVKRPLSPPPPPPPPPLPLPGEGWKKAKVRRREGSSPLGFRVISPVLGPF